MASVVEKEHGLDFYSGKFLEPEKPAQYHSCEQNVLTSKQIKQWREEGYCIVNDIIPISLLKAALDEAKYVFDTKLSSPNDFGSNGFLEFPTDSEHCNQITLHPRLLKCISQLLNDKSKDCRNIRLAQSDLWLKIGTTKNPNDYGEYENFDQRVHMDYPNHTLVHPPKFNTNEPEYVEIILYLSNVNNCGGATAVIPKKSDNDPIYDTPYMNMPGTGDLPWINNRAHCEDMILRRIESASTIEEKEKYLKMRSIRNECYEREEYVKFDFGTILFYRHDTWHRGTRIFPTKKRYVMNMAFKRKDCDWIQMWQRGVAYFMYKESLFIEKFIAQCSVMQRNVLGFPCPGHKYWTDYTLNAVRNRYEVLGMDMTPYWAELMKNKQKNGGLYTTEEVIVKKLKHVKPVPSIKSKL